MNRKPLDKGRKEHCRIETNIPLERERASRGFGLSISEFKAMVSKTAFVLSMYERLSDISKHVNLPLTA